MMMSFVLSSLSIMVNMLTQMPCTFRHDAIPFIIMLSTFFNEMKCCFHIQMVYDAPVSMQTDLPPVSNIAFPFFLILRSLALSNVLSVLYFQQHFAHFMGQLSAIHESPASACPFRSLSLVYYCLFPGLVPTGWRLCVPK
jgi:hypothetical protein